MELATTLKSQTVQNRIREVGINPNYWYPVGWASQLLPSQIQPVMIWQQAIAVYRDENGQLHALEDACPHKGVALHKGQVQGCHLACPYHGWQFNGSGECVHIPYLPPEQKLPRAKARSYPVQEKYNLIWIFPGNAALAANVPLPEIPEFHQPEWLMVPLAAQFQAHFSICNENTMDVFHGYLHRNLQGWFNPQLKSLRETETTLCAEYEVSYKSRIAKFLGLSDKGNKVTTRTISIQYRYPHYYSSLEGVSSLYLMRLPVGPTESRSFALFFFKLPLPQWLLNPLKPVLSKILERFVLRRFLAQDIEMIESEQRSYLANRERRYVEINPAIIALQRLIMRQYDYYMQESIQSQEKISQSLCVK
ncbi:MAG: aromatic ring-hydroxylating dioxygenase subunit alpha [Oscillatoriaceae bacterium SKW80]|nr:aromatic ring-hydroxylating dioxygenase subunit alpha [Oscillatoriaceae bacterium SKYG93]MCX8120568.1 aromatic ring-hydroxylating dioxygenase subunit alpha [Oscillatoriaceae bacterium SKW80]MDW8453895.1 aromatic ring-hydroxylating dioxygenase subunit alpha [Oscillatoriaceae cyanobacterium SKYGB_i_bin93]HIK27124.1 aromatic ring-hydroxylating dioxygenase subunit alpha [Oscillatoriaceae cyanobacterium M7585_C2015_266]